MGTVNLWLFALGVAILLVMVVDLLWTTLWTEGGQGPLTSRLTSWMWRSWKRVVPHERDRVLGLAGPLATLLTVATWVVLLWGGWVVVFSADPNALRSTRGAGSPDLSGTIYFVAYTVFTMGNGDFMPVGDGWQLATGLATASGLLLVSLLITYIVSLTAAVVQKRSFASQVHGLGDTPADVVVGAWDGEGFPGLDLQLQSLTTRLGVVTEQHLTYPILHYYHAATRSKSSALAVAKLDEVLTLLSHGVEPGSRPAPTILRSARSGVRTYLSTLRSAFIDASPRAPPPPDLDPLQRAGVPMTHGSALEDALARNEERRRLTLAAVRGDGWRWSDLQDRGDGGATPP